MIVGILRETKQPPDRRVPLTPSQMQTLQRTFPEHAFRVQASPVRAYTDKEYRDAGLTVSEDISGCELLLGVKEVDLNALLPEKTYLIFSHTAKEQPQNQKLLRRMSDLHCTLIDYEYLTKNSNRVVAFGYWAGIVGAYNALLGYGLQTRLYTLKPAPQCRDLHELKAETGKIKTQQPLRIVITGEGRVASGASEILMAAGIKRITPEEFLLNPSKENVFCHTGPQHYTRHFSGKAFDFNHFIQHPGDYESQFSSYTHRANIMIACHFWDKRSPHFFTPLDLQHPEFSIRLISDISCDIPGPLPTTVRTSTMEKPFYGIDRTTGLETPPFQPDKITVAAVDNLPSALPRDASRDFGDALIHAVIPELLASEPGEIIHGASILHKGQLTEKFSYLETYLKGTK